MPEAPWWVVLCPVHEITAMSELLQRGWEPFAASGQRVYLRCRLPPGDDVPPIIYSVAQVARPW